MILKFQVESKDGTDVVWQYIDSIASLNKWHVVAGDVKSKLKKLNDGGIVYTDHRINLGGVEMSDACIMYLGFRDGTSQWHIANSNIFLLNDEGKTIERL